MYEWIFCENVCMCTSWMFGSEGHQNTVLELELETAIRYDVIVGNLGMKPKSSARVVGLLNYWDISLAPRWWTFLINKINQDG